jgi:hypothetical protein
VITHGRCCNHLQGSTYYMVANLHNSSPRRNNGSISERGFDFYRPRPPHFPKHSKLEYLITSGFTRSPGMFLLPMLRREARDLRKWFFGPIGSREVPTDQFGRRCAGVMTFDLPRGWGLSLLYGAPPPKWTFKAGKVHAVFSPPRGARRAAA